MASQSAISRDTLDTLEASFADFKGKEPGTYVATLGVRLERLCQRVLHAFQRAQHYDFNDRER